VEDAVEQVQRPRDEAGRALGRVDRPDLRDLLADRDVQRGRDQVRQRDRDEQRDPVRDALAQEVLDQGRDRRLAEEADAQRGERDAELAGRQVPRQVVADLHGQRGAAPALLGLSLQVRPARAHEGELRRDEEAVQQDEHDDGEKQQRRGHARGRGRRIGAPLLRDESSSFIRRLSRD
jgi:hypothetical protein